MVRRQWAFKEMTEAMQTVSKEVEKLFVLADRGPVVIAWKIGHMLKPVVEKRASTGRTP